MRPLQVHARTLWLWKAFALLKQSELLVQECAAATTLQKQQQWLTRATEEDRRTTVVGPEPPAAAVERGGPGLHFLDPAEKAAKDLVRDVADCHARVLLVSELEWRQTRLLSNLYDESSSTDLSNRVVAT